MKKSIFVFVLFLFFWFQVLLGQVPVLIDVGDILYKDNSVSRPTVEEINSNIAAGKEPKGVIFWVDPADPVKGWAVELKYAFSNGVVWDALGTDIPTLSNYNTSRAALADTAGQQNTDAMRTAMPGGTAADKVNYADGWYLPAAGQLRLLYSEQARVDASLTALGNSNFGFANVERINKLSHWTSTENSSSEAYYVFYDGSLDKGNKQTSDNVRSYSAFTANISPTSLIVEHPDGMSATNYKNIGDVITNFDGTQAIVYRVSRTSGEDWAVALSDVSSLKQWSVGGVFVPTLPNISSSGSSWDGYLSVLKDMDGFSSTQKIRNTGDADKFPAAYSVDFNNGWYLPSSSQLSELYALQPALSAIPDYVAMRENTSYWSSTQQSLTSAWAVDGNTGSYTPYNNKMASYVVRPVRSVATYKKNYGDLLSVTAIVGSTYQWYVDGVAIAGATSATCPVKATGGYYVVVSNGGISETSKTVRVILGCTIKTDVSPTVGGTVSGGGIYIYGSSASLTASPNPGYQFLQWFDGNTNNPRTINVTQDSVFTALFCKIPDATITATPSAICEGDFATLSVASASEIKWFENGTELTEFVNQNTIAVNPSTTTTYDVTVKNEYKHYVKGERAALANINIGNIITTDSLLIASEYWAVMKAAGKVAMGIVVMKDDMGNIRILNCSIPSDESLYKVMSLGGYGIDITGIPNNLSTGDFNGKANTDAMVNELTGATPDNCAAKWVRTTLGEQWYIPALGELGALFDNKNTINNTLGILDIPTLENQTIFSSSEVSANQQYGLYIGDGTSQTIEKNANRPVMAYMIFEGGKSIYFVDSISTSCDATGNQEITVQQNSTITLTSAPGTDNQTLCFNTPITNITYSTTNAEGATITGLPQGVTYRWENNTVIVGGTPTTEGMHDYTVTLTANCGAATITGTITVNTATVGGTVSSNQAICNNTAPATLTLSSHVGDVVKWQSSVDGTTWTDITNNSTSYTPPALTVTTYYRAVVKSGVCAEQESSTATITILPPMTVVANNPSQTVCSGASLTALSVTAGGGDGIYSYQWYSNTTASNSGGTLISGATNNTYTPNTSTLSSLYYYCQVTSCETVASPVSGLIAVSPNPVVSIQATNNPTTPGGNDGSVNISVAGGTSPYNYSWSNGSITQNITGLTAGTYHVTVTDNVGCTGNASATLTNPTPMTFTASATVPNVCFGSSDGVITVSNVTGGVSPYSVSKDNTTWDVYTDNYQFTALSAGTYTIWVKDVNNYTVSQQVTINAYAELSGGVIGSNQTICNNTAPASFTNITSGSGGSGTANYQWQISTDNINFSNVAGTNDNYTHTVLSTGSYYFRRQFSNSCGTAYSNTVTITVYSPLAITTNLSTVPQTVCQNSPFTTLHIVASGAANDYLYQWYSNTLSSTSGGTLISGATNSSYTPLSATVGTSYYYVVVTSTLCTTESVTSLVSGSFTTDALTVGGTVSSSQSICNNTAPATLTLSGHVGDVVKWQSSVDRIVWTDIANTSTSYAPPILTATTYYRAVVKNGTCTEQESSMVTISITSDNIITLTSATGSNNQTVCINTPIANITYSTTSATGATFAGLPNGITGSWATDEVTISGMSTQSGTFNYTVTLTGGCGAITTTTGTINVTLANTITLTSAAGTDAQTVYRNNPITTISYITTGATGATFTEFPGITSSWVNNIVTISGTPVTIGTHTYTITLVGGCGNVNASGTIDVLDNAFILTFNPTGGTVDPNVKGVNYNEIVGTLPTPVKTGYIFTGWKIGDADITNTTVWNYTSNQTADAQWRPINYTIVYQGNKPSTSSHGVTGNTPSTVCAYDVETSLQTNGFILTGWKFMGWANTPNATTPNYIVPGATVFNLSSTDGDRIFLYALWESTTSTIHFNITLNGGTGQQEDVTATYDAPMPRITTIPTKTGYTFSGYWDAPKGGVQYYSNTLTSLRKWNKVTNDTLYAQFKPKRYKVTFNPGQDASMTPRVIYVFYDSIYGKPESATTLMPFPIPRRQGYVFDGWFTSLSTTGVKITEQTKVKITQDIILYAKFIPIKLTPISDSTTLKQSICINTPIQEIRYLVEGVKIYNTDNFPQGIVGRWDGDTLIIAGAPSRSGDFHAFLIIGEGDFSVEVYLSVKPESQIILLSDVHSEEQIISMPNPISTIEYKITEADSIEFLKIPTWMTYDLITEYSTNNLLLSLKGQPNKSGVHNYQFKLINGCGNLTGFGTINSLSLKGDALVITPNGDGLNDVLEMLAAKVFQDNELIIYNRVGQMVYQQKSYNNDFDGYSLTDGIYIYVFKYVDEQNNKHIFTNTITIAR